MTKTSSVKRALCLFFFAGSALGQVDLSAEEKNLSKRVSDACKVPFEFNLHDYEYGRDEMRTYQNRHFEDASLLASELARACTIDPANANKIARIRTLTLKRGSHKERKLIQRKDGQLVYLVAYNPTENGHRDDMLQADLKSVAGLSYEKPQVVPKKEEKKAEVKAETPLAENRDKKIAELTAWFQEEVKKAQTLPPAQMGPKMEALQKTFQEKLNALTTTP